AMKRGVSSEQVRGILDRLRDEVPGVAVRSTFIVGFPGESEAQFQDTHDLLAELKLDKVHIAKYSPRPGTLSARHMVDDVPAEEKERRRKALDDLQAGIVADINNRLLGERAQVLVEDFHRGKWRGRTRTNKLVFFEDERDRTAELVDVEITWAGPWSLRGRLPDASVDAPPPLAVTVA
ncbi:MAG: TRAM domain-containing protein, partial [Anaerolineales bacterium]|nr:TRAM domain-containing protein [Anaerolineales bacterium]